MSWVKKHGKNLYDTEPEHECKPPRDTAFGQPAGEPGDVWRCDECETLWVHKIEAEPLVKPRGYPARAYYWKKAGWRLRRRHRLEGYE